MLSKTWQFSQLAQQVVLVANVQFWGSDGSRRIDVF